jgi:peptide methionine sulfoxide reductase MsrA
MEQVLTMHHTLNAKYVERATYKDRIIDYAQQRDKTVQKLKKTLAEIHKASKKAFSEDPGKAFRYCIHYHQSYYKTNKHRRKRKRSVLTA